MALTKISSDRREPFYGHRIAIIEGTLPAAGAGVQTEAHSGVLPYEALDRPRILSILVIGADGAIIENNNPASIANSDYQLRITSTDIETEVPAAQTNVASQTFRIYLEHFYSGI